MLKRAVLAAAVAAMIAGPAVAGQCPLDMGKIDQALAGNPSVSEAELARVKELRAEGEALHNAGDHAKSVEVLAEAKAILGIE